jgi:hypothetical protein
MNSLNIDFTLNICTMQFSLLTYSKFDQTRTRAREVVLGRPCWAYSRLLHAFPLQAVVTLEIQIVDLRV